MDQKTQLLIRVDDTLKTEVTEEERKYRKDNFPNENAILKKNLLCTACNKDLKERIISRHQINVHPVLEVLWCSKCEEFYDDGNFSMDEDGSDKYCRWCAQGGQLYCCSYCSIAFCASCVRRNFKRTKVIKDIEADDWRCFVCVTEPLWNLRALCDAAKRYVESHLNRRKSHRSIKLNESDEETAETVDSEASSTKSRKKKQNDKQPKNSKSNTESEENVFVETNRSKRKRASSGEETTTQSKNKRKPREEVDPAVKENQKKKKDFESIVNEAINDFGAFRKILTKKETSLKKEYSNADVSHLDEIIAKAQEEFSKVCNNAKTSLETIEKKITQQLSTLLSKPEEEKPQSPVKDVQAPSAEPEEDSKDENAADVTIPTENTEEDSAKSSPTAPVNGQVEEGADDMSLTVICDEETPKEHPEDASKSSKSINDSMAVNVSSIIGSLKTDDDTTIIENTIEPKKPDDTIEDVEMIEDTVNDDVEMIEDPKPTNDISTQLKEEKIVDNSTLESCKNDDSPLSKDKASKLALLQSSTDNASSSDNEGTKAKSSDSELSGVSVLHSDPDEANTTKRKKRKTRKELDKLSTKAVSKKEDDGSDEDAEINRLTNIDSLKKRKKCNASSENDDSEPIKSEKEDLDKSTVKSATPKIKDSSKESNEEDNKNGDLSSQKKKKCFSSNEKKNAKSVLDYFSDSGQDSNASNASFSKFNSLIEDKHKAFLNNKEELSKKCLLSSSDDEPLENGNENEVGSSKKSSIKKEKSAVKKSIVITSDEDAEKNEKNKDKKKEKSKWRNDPLLRQKISDTDTSDEERMIQRERRRRQKESEKTKTPDSSDSEDLFRPKKRESTVKKRKAKLHSSGSEFDVGKAEGSDDSVQIISEDENPPPRSKKRRRIKKFDDSNSSADENDGKSSAPGSASKGRKQIRKILKEEDLAEITIRTAKEEEERKKRIAARQALFNESFKLDENWGEKLNKLVLDFDPETKKELVAVHPTLIKKLKPHQAKGVKFMWDSCFESVKMTKTTEGGGCILAHCMGLGKTLQVITLVHTVMRYPELNMNRVLIICPLSTVLNWVAEFELWLRDLDDRDDINVFHLRKNSNNVIRADYLNNWFREGGVMVLGYEMFRNLINTTKCKKRIKEYFTESLLDPGPDLVVCDEGHMLKNEASALSQAAMKIRTRRRIVLTGTPLQNNLKEYHCMVQFVKPNLLGDKKEFLNRFANPITNGQYSDSTSHDVRVMKRRAHVLHKMLDGVVQRFDYNVLTPFLPNKHEFVIMVALSDLQAKLYQYYIDHYSKKVHPQSKLFKDYQIMRLIWTHPLAMKLGEERRRKIEERKDYDSEGSLKDFVVHSSNESDDSGSDKSDNSIVSIRSGESNKGDTSKRRLTRAKKKELGIGDDDLYVLDNDDSGPAVWWKSMINEEEMDDYRMGPKIILLFAILKHCENIGDKLLVFSQSIPSLDMIEYFLERYDSIQEKEQKQNKTEDCDSYGTWQKGVDYFRLDGQTAPELRTMYCNAFNKTSNMRARLFLISTKAGGLGINLTAANRVVIFDASWNPSYDVQSIFRIYRFGQNKPCYIYRFLSQGTMEEKIYERQVTKLSISCRVVDEQQIDRHFNNADVEALYEFNRKTPSEDEIPKLPKDRLMAELLKEYKNIILGYLEHDSLLENIAEEELTEEERKQAWEDYENEKKGKIMNFQNQQFTMSAAQADIMFNKDTIMAALKKEHPLASGEQLEVMYTMVREKLKNHYLAQLQMQQQQIRAAHMMNQANKAADPFAQQKHAAYVQNLQLQNKLEQQAREKLQADYIAKHGSTSQK